MTRKIAIVGAGGFARQALDICDACNQVKPIYEVLGFIVDPQYGAPGTIVNGKPILGGFDWLEQQAHQVQITCAVGPPQFRYQLVQRAKELDCSFVNLIHPNAIHSRWLVFGEGVIISAGCILTNQVHVGNHVHIGLDCTVSHDSVLEDFATLAPGVHITGNVALRTGCYVGTGTNVIQEMELGEWSVVGAGSTIIKNVPQNSTVVGVPGKVIKTRKPGWYLN